MALPWWHTARQRRGHNEVKSAQTWVEWGVDVRQFFKLDICIVVVLPRVKENLWRPLLPGNNSVGARFLTGCCNEVVFDDWRCGTGGQMCVKLSGSSSALTPHGSTAQCGAYFNTPPLLCSELTGSTPTPLLPLAQRQWNSNKCQRLPDDISQSGRATARSGTVT